MPKTVKTSLNDVDMGAVASLAGKIQQEPGVAATLRKAQDRWQGGFRSQARIRDIEPIASDEPGSPRNLNLVNRRVLAHLHCGVRGGDRKAPSYSN